MRNSRKAGGEMKLLIIRHGQSEADLLNVHEGRADFALTEAGKTQAGNMARAVCKNHCITRIYSSPLKRAAETAGYLALETGLSVEMLDDLMEFQNGLIAGMDRAEALEKYPPVENLPLHESVYGQESKLEFRFRAERALSRILSENDAEATVAVVTHGGMINQLYHAFLKLPVESAAGFPTGDTGVHCWLVSGKKRLILQANDTSHNDREP